MAEGESTRRDVDLSRFPSVERLGELRNALSAFLDYWWVFATSEAIDFTLEDIERDRDKLRTRPMGVRGWGPEVDIALRHVRESLPRVADGRLGEEYRRLDSARRTLIRILDDPARDP